MNFFLARVLDEIITFSVLRNPVMKSIYLC